MTPIRASSLERIALCPGSYHLEQQVAPEDVPGDNPISASGTQIHAALSGLDHRKLTVDEDKIFDLCQSQMARVLSDLGRKPEAIDMELEMSLTHGERVLLTGHPDYIALFPTDKMALVADYKTGFLEVAPAAANLQLRAYVLMTAQRHPKQFDTYYAVILQPRTGQPTVAEYGREDLVLAWKEIRAIVDRAERTTAEDLTPGEAQCKYCPARLVCPALLKQTTALAKLDTDKKRWLDLPAAEKLKIYDQLRMAKRAIYDLELRYKQELEADPQAYGGLLSLTEGSNKREVTDPGQLYLALASYNISAEEFAGACKVGLTKIKTMLRDRLRFTGWQKEDPKRTWEEFQNLDAKELRKIDCVKGKEFEVLFEELLAPVVETKRTAPSLKRTEDKV